MTAVQCERQWNQNCHADWASRMAARLNLLRRSGATPESEDPLDQCCDVQELASEAAEALEAYQRAPWRQLSDSARMAKLRRAIRLLNRVEGLETGRIPIRIWGD